MTFALGTRSRERLEGVHPKLVKVVELAITISKQDFSVLEGVRTLNRQYELYAQGRTVAQLRARNIPTSVLAQPSKRKVTWTLNSKHFVNKETGFGHAVDLTPYPLDWNDTAAFDAIAAAMMKAADMLGVKLRWGANWDGDTFPRERGEYDSPHFELA